MVEIAEWLERRGLGQYAEVLAKNDIDLDVLPHLTDADLKEIGALGLADLKELGLSLGHRRKLLATLAEAPATPHEPAAPASDEEAERRQLTVMFCDLVGSTQLSEQLDPEELREVLRRYHDTVTDAVAAHGGHVAKLLGDGVLAYFGWPVAHEDAAVRAIRAALAAVTAVADIQTAEAPLAARAGIATGLVVIGDMIGETAQEHGAVAGATPNLAARLQGLAAPGEVVIQATTRRLVGGAFEFDDMGTHDLKGFAEPVQVWRATGAARTDNRFEALHGASMTDFVGRAHEIGLLEARWRLARGGEGQVAGIYCRWISPMNWHCSRTAGAWRGGARVRWCCSPERQGSARVGSCASSPCGSIPRAAGYCATSARSTRSTLPSSR